MLIETKKVETTVETEIALDECVGHVMLSLRYGKYKFGHALTVRDMGKILAVCNQYKEQAVCCEGDLVVNCDTTDHMVIEFIWHAEGHECKVVLETTDMFVFEWACRSYCRQLFRTNKGV
jgi:hypothetical protein